MNARMNIEEWMDIALPFEEELEDCVVSIYKERNISGDEVMEGNASIVGYARGGHGYVIKTDEGDRMFLPSISYKGCSDEIGTRIRIGKIMRKEGKSTCLDAMECVDFNELKYRMFSNIEDGRMTLAATSAWAIYEGASESLRTRMRNAVHSLRDAFKAYRGKAAA